MLRACLDRFYSRAKGEEGVDEYSRTKEQGRMLLLHLLMTALIAEEFTLGARQFEALRATLKLTPKEMVTYYRRAPGCCFLSQADAPPVLCTVSTMAQECFKPPSLESSLAPRACTTRVGCFSGSSPRGI